MSMKKFYVGVKALIHDESRGYLLIRRSQDDTNGGYWDLPGGRLDKDESYEQALAREIAEELPGSEFLSRGDLLGTHKLAFDVAPDTGLVLLFFDVEASVPEKVSLSEEHDAVQWVVVKSDIPTENIGDEIATILNNKLN